jgi:diguanylate cyclase (GGDEF)-like protein
METAWGILEIHLGVEEMPERETMFNFELLAQGIVRLLENNVQLERMVSVDRLTQIHNRNYYETQMPLEIERANRNRQKLAFLMADIDHFKVCNDEHGHDVGDKVLHLVAQTIKGHLRRIDLLFRYGGEEFAVLLPGADRDAAERTAERIREVVSITPLTLDDGTNVSVTISIGGCIYPDNAQNDDELFRSADKALFRAKQEGRNRVSFYDREP